MRRDHRRAVCAGGGEQAAGATSPPPAQQERAPSPGGSARLTGVPAVVHVADKHRVTSTQIVLAWPPARDDGIMLIPRTSTVVHLEENMAAREVELDDDDLAILDQVVRPAAPPSEPLTAANDPGITIIQRGLLTWTWVILPRMQTGGQVPLAGRPRSEWSDHPLRQQPTHVPQTRTVKVAAAPGRARSEARPTTVRRPIERVSLPVGEQARATAARAWGVRGV